MAMTNAELESVFTAALGNGHAAALRAIYTLGYANGAGLTIDSNLGDRARTATAPTSAQVATLLNHSKIKKPD